jgi:hypothetical protein
MKRQRAESTSGDDAISLLLVIMIAFLAMAVLLMGSPRSAALTVDQINMMPVWGP